MKIVIENYGKTFTAELSEDAFTYEALEACLCLLEAHGYDMDNLDGLDRDTIKNASVNS
jgi:hypothetical protein